MPSEEYEYMLGLAELMMDVGDAPEWDETSDPYQQKYSRNWLDYQKRELKAAAKAHLYLHSLKPKMVPVQHFLRWHPKSDEYRAIQMHHDNLLSEAKRRMANIKSTMNLDEETVKMANLAKEHREAVEVPALKLMLEQMNKQKESANAMAHLVEELKNSETKMANDARRERIKRLEKALTGRNLTEEELEQKLANEKAAEKNNLANTLRAKHKANANKAWKNERQELENMLAGKTKSFDEKLAHALGYSGEEMNTFIAERKASRNEQALKDKALINEIKTSHRQHLNTIRAEKQKRNQAKTQSKSRKSKSYRKTRRV